MCGRGSNYLDLGNHSMACNLQFSAKNLDVESLIVQLDLNINPEDIYREGNPLYWEGPLYSESGFTITYTDADFTSLKQQINDAIYFIKTHRIDLKIIGDLKQSLPHSKFDFNFCVHTRMFDEIIQDDQFPTELLKLLGEIGASLSFTQFQPPSLSEENGEDED